MIILEFQMSRQQDLTVDNLRKISLSVEAGTTQKQMELTREPERLDFIYGIGSKGITPFEYELANRKKGEVVAIHVRPETASAYFAHLGCVILPHIDKRNETYLKVTVRDVVLPDNREIITAMAQRTECGAGCDCGCGC